jgi:hypothetical protein
MAVIHSEHSVHGAALLAAEQARQAGGFGGCKSGGDQDRGNSVLSDGPCVSDSPPSLPLPVMRPLIYRPANIETRSPPSPPATFR